MFLVQLVLNEGLDQSSSMLGAPQLRRNLGLIHKKIFAVIF